MKYLVSHLPAAGCNMPATFFVLEVGTDCGFARAFWEENSEVRYRASGAVSSSGGSVLGWLLTTFKPCSSPLARVAKRHTKHTWLTPVVAVQIAIHSRTHLPLTQPFALGPEGEPNKRACPRPSMHTLSQQRWHVLMSTC
jgi:hypothetical protein